MTISFGEFNKNLKKEIFEYEHAYGDLQEKILNENIADLHTMLVKSDFENFLINSKVNLSEMGLAETADLTDFILYEKELAKLDGDKTR